MGVVDRKRELFENVVRLRRIGRELPGNEDVARTRLTLEHQLGSTVSLRLAARLLGVSHTALARWAAAGDLPVVLTPTGRREVPVPALLDLHVETRGGGLGQPGRYVLASAMKRRRQMAHEIHIAVPVRDSRDEDAHGRALDRNLAYHAAIAERLTPSMVAEARYVLFRWCEEGRIDPRYAGEWKELLSEPLSRVRQAITAAGSGADDLRQNSPFAGMLSEPERRRILAEVR
ncbi:MAG TPA: hypothetical protein VMU32_07750 [Solirubrobacteraceae bacterium]|nr:hypothetical protein [Solirubrobacteraceae bacterium]